jgi:signal peptidase I
MLESAQAWAILQTGSHEIVSIGPMSDLIHSLKCELASESLRVSGILRLKVSGWSMLPTIWPGDMLIISRLDGRELFPGEIALYQREGRFIIHRVLSTISGGLNHVLTRGDAMLQHDAPVPSDDLLGKVDFILRNGRKIEPSRKLRLAQCAVAGLAQRSEVGARVIVGFQQLYGALQTSKEN